MDTYAKRLLKLKMRRGELGETLASKFASADRISESVDRIRQIASMRPESPVASKMAAVLVSAHDYLESLPLVDGFKKVAEVTSNALDEMRALLAERQLMHNPTMLPYRYPELMYQGMGYSPTLYHAGRIARLWDDKLMGIPNRPGPLSSMLLLGTAGALAGRGAGMAADKVQGRRNQFRRNLYTVGGAALGVLPGLAYAGFNALSGKPAFTSAVLDNPSPLAQKQSRVYADLSKIATAFTPMQFQALLDDPDVANRMPPMISAAAQGFMAGAQRLPGRRSDLPIITPLDVAQMAVGLGTGYASGLFVGKALGGLFGLSDSSQQVLRRSGAAAGLLKSVIPIAYGY